MFTRRTALGVLLATLLCLLAIRPSDSWGDPPTGADDCWNKDKSKISGPPSKLQPYRCQDTQDCIGADGFTCKLQVGQCTGEVLCPVGGCPGWRYSWNSTYGT